jgi:5-methylcytosine-specific restriction endonuclease McrA
MGNNLHQNYERLSDEAIFHLERTDISPYLLDPEEDEVELMKTFVHEAYEEYEHRQHGYYEYIKSEKWNRIKESVLKRDKVCQGCGYPYGESCQVHHKKYIPRHQETPQNISHLVLLCSRCHSMEHDRR